MSEGTRTRNDHDKYCRDVREISTLARATLDDKKAKQSFMPDKVIPQPWS
jgi:hypothetical protein